MKKIWRLGMSVAVAGALACGYPTVSFAAEVNQPAPGGESVPATSAVLAEPAVPAAPTVKKVELHLYHLTDVHGHIEQIAKYDKKDKNKIVGYSEAGLAAVGCYLDKARAEHPASSFTLLGDNIGASPFVSGINYDNPTIAALNELKPEGSTIGNHELDLGQDVFRARLNGTSAKVNDKDVRFVKVGFPYLGANVEGLGNKSDGTPALGKYAIKEMDGVKVAFIGAIAQDVPEKLLPGTTKGLNFKDPIAEINTLAKELKESGKADVVIAMLDDDVKKNIGLMDAKYVNGIMGGDTHVPYYLNPADGYKIPGTASGSYTDNLSKMVLTYDPATKTTTGTVEPISAAELAKCDVTTSATAQKITKIVEEAKANAEVKKKEVVATGLTPNMAFKRAVVGEKGEPGSNRGHESTLGDLVADAYKSVILTREGKPVDVAMINAGGMRADLTVSPEGTLTYGDTYEVQPFSNEIGYVKITGENLRNILEQQWKTGLTTQNSRPMLKVGVSSNLNYVYDPYQPMGKRIVGLSLDGKPVDPQAYYTVGSVNFLLEGGDSFPAFASNGAPITNGDLDREFFNKYLREHAKEIKVNSERRSVGMHYSVVDDVFRLHLRGLSFTEGPGLLDYPAKVSVTLGKYKFMDSAVDLKLTEPGLSTEDYNNPDAAADKAPITTDGAGYTNLGAWASEICKANDNKVVDLPFTVVIDDANETKEYKYISELGYKVTLPCDGTTPAPGSGDGDKPVPAPTPGDGDKPAPTPTPGEGDKPAPAPAPAPGTTTPGDGDKVPGHDNTPGFNPITNPGTGSGDDGNGLAETGSESALPAALAGMLMLFGAAALAVRRRS